MNKETLKTKKPWTRKTHELIGKVLSKDLRKSYEHQKDCPQSELKAGQECSEVNCYYGSTFWRLNVSLENSPIERIYVYQSYLEKEQVWKDILESNYIDQRYLFFCSKSRKTGNYQLTNWKTLKPKEGKNGK
jgi:hypothetical protein